MPYYLYNTVVDFEDQELCKDFVDSLTKSDKAKWILGAGYGVDSYTIRKRLGNVEVMYNFFLLKDDSRFDFIKTTYFEGAKLVLTDKEEHKNLGDHLVMVSRGSNVTRELFNATRELLRKVYKIRF